MGIMKMDLKRTFRSIKFPMAVIATAILWYLNTRRFSAEEDVLAIFFAAVGRSTITYIALAVCGGVYDLSICEDFQDREIRHILSRVCLKKYVLSKIAACMTGAVITYIFGTVIYLIFEMTQHPLTVPDSLAVANLQELTTFHGLLPEYTIIFVLLQVFLNGLCCGCMAVVAMGISPYIRDGFLVLCIPPVLFFLLLFFSQNLLKLTTDTESIFWIIMTEKPCGIFLINVFLYTVCFLVISSWLLYHGIRRYEYE